MKKGLLINEKCHTQSVRVDFDPMLMKCARMAPKGRVLDLGLGDTGRNALFFAGMGYEVEGIDISKTVIEKCAIRASEMNLEIKLHDDNISTFSITPNKYSIILATYMWQYFSRSEAKRIISGIKEGLQKNGIVYIGAFSIEDACYIKASENSEFKLTEEHTFYSLRDRWWSCQTSSKGTYVHCFTKEELLSLFSDMELLHCAEVVDMDVDHSEPHYHSLIIYIGRRIV